MKHERYHDTGTNYSQIAFHALHGLYATEVTEAEYEEMLCMMPPIHVPGGFLVCEALTSLDRYQSTAGAHGEVHSMYATACGRYFAKYVVRGKPETYINTRGVFAFYPLEKQ